MSIYRRMKTTAPIVLLAAGCSSAEVEDASEDSADNTETPAEGGASEERSPAETSVETPAESATLESETAIVGSRVAPNVTNNVRYEIHVHMEYRGPGQRERVRRVTAGKLERKLQGLARDSDQAAHSFQDWMCPESNYEQGQRRKRERTRTDDWYRVVGAGNR
ncbi:hypothetical protein ACFLZN_00495 [Nanoarchaeota archaeon]